MSWFTGLFGGGEATTTTVVAPPPPAVPFTERAQTELDALAAASTRAGRDLSTAAYSLLRTIDDIIRPLIDHIWNHPVVVEREVAIESLLTDYVPNTLTVFLRLPEEDRADGSPADLSLCTQLETLALGARELADGIHQDAVNALQTNAIFLQNKFD